MIRSDLTMSDWARMSDEAAHHECEALARALPHGLKVTSLQTHAYCGRTHRVARFDCREAGDEVHFVLVPGGEVTVGFDGRNFKPSPQQIKSFAKWPAELIKRGMDVRYVKFSIEEFVDSHTSPRRTVFVPATLVEVEAQEVALREDIEPLSRDDPVFTWYYERLSEPGEYRSGVPSEPSHIVERDEAGAIRVWRRGPTTVDYVKEQLAKIGMRLLTCDEWEHACGAGAPTLFRWGDDTPSDFYPTETCAEHRELNRAWVRSLGKLRYETPPPGWDLHQQLNLFGLRIANNPYEMDLVADEPWALGGDGGCNICGGAGFFLGWLPLATAFRDLYRDDRFRPDKDNVADDYHRVRRVIPID